MPMSIRSLMLFRSAALFVALVIGLPATAGAAQEAPFHFEVEEGQNLNYFLRDGMSAAHLLLRSGQAPRILVAFPAGNSGVGVWFQPQQVSSPQWAINSAPSARVARDSAGRPLYGITFEASIATRSLEAKQAVLSSVRFLRDYQSSGTVPEEVVVRPQSTGNTLSWARNRLDGAAGYRLTLEVIDGTLLVEGRIRAGADGRIRLRVTALSGEAPLTPLADTALLNGRQEQDQRARDTLTFLSYQEKLLAGSWRFNTYFGRDTLMSVRLLMPVLAPQAIEAGLRSVLARLSAAGEVAHEEGIGEFAVLSHRRQDGALSDAPLFDYAMIDGNYLLAPVLAIYLLENPDGRKRAAGYLRSEVALPGGPKISAGRALIRNLRLIATTTGNFSADPRHDNLISLKPGRKTGQWRDSEDGIGGGRYPYDVNAVLVPAALEATARLLASGLLDPFVTPADRRLLGNTSTAVKVWRERAPRLFNTTIDNERARAAVNSYARQIGVPAEDAPAGNPRWRCPERDSALPTRTVDRCRRPGSQSGLRRRYSQGALHQSRLSRHGSLVVATSSVRQRPRAATRARRPADAGTTAPADRSANTLAGHPGDAVRTQLGIVELAFRGRSLPCRAVWVQQCGRRRVECCAAMEQCISGGQGQMIQGLRHEVTR
jgi:hypothetical protein